MSTRLSLERIAQDWAEVRPDLDTRPMLTFIALNRTAKMLESALERGYAASGLNSASFDLLLTLYRSSPPEGFTPSGLATSMAVTPATVTNRIDCLLERNLAKREPSSEDRRSLRIHLTPEGREMVEQFLPLHLENERQLLSSFSPEEHAALERLLDKLSGALEAAEGRD